MDDGALYRLMTWLSPAYPVGGFCHSNGLEWAVEAGWVTDRITTQAWLESLLEHGAGWNDTVLFSFAHRAVLAGDRDALDGIIALAAAAHPCAERRTETLSQGEAFRQIAINSGAASHNWFEACDGLMAYPVAVAVLAGEHDIALSQALTAYLHGWTSNLISAAQRLVPLGQTDAQIVLAGLQPVVAATVERACACDTDDPFRALGGASWLADLASMRHETQYTRLFRT